MSDLMYEPTEDKPLQQWQKWANLARLEAIRADKAEAQRDTLLAALKEVVQPIRNAEYALSRVTASPLVKEALADTRNGLRGV